ncbi:MAG: DUF2490 domain-containing protein [Caulobacter sp.]
MIKRSGLAISAFLATAAALAVSPAVAADEDFQAWLSGTGTIGLTPNVDATAEAHFRYYDDAGYLGQLLLRPSLTYKLRDGWALTGGYAYVRTDPTAGATSKEHRVWEQVGYRFVSSDTMTITGRTRLEQRFFEGRNGTGWRVRQQVRAAFDLPRAGKVQAVAWNETFYSMNDTDFGQRAGFDQTRTFVGIAIPVLNGTTVEPGYLNQTVFRDGPDQSNHALAVNLFARF